MRTTTVRLDNDDEELLDFIAADHGGRSGALRQGIRELAEAKKRQLALGDFLEAWERESGPADEAEVQAMIEYYKL